MSKRVAIIGAGCSGLTAIKSCLDEGLEPVCFERESDIGGLWNYTDHAVPGKGSVYKSCVINTSKEMMAFSDFPPPKDFPTFLPHRFVLQYLRLYAERFQLLKYINFQTSVESIKMSPDYEHTGRWIVQFTCLKSGQCVSQVFDGVLVCSGHHTYPYQPQFSGLDSFKGTSIHSHSYRTPHCFTDKNVLVVGFGNSAVDIAVDLSNVTKQVYLSTRRGAWVIGRKSFFGLPADAVANNRMLFKLPKDVLQWSVEKMADINFDHETYGIKPAHRPLDAHPTINDELPMKMMSGKIKIKPDVNSFDEAGINFMDGTYEKIDAVIFATGYSYHIKFLDDSIVKIEKNQTCLYKYMYPPQLPHPTLAVVGLVQAVGAVMPISEMQCRWYTRVLKGHSSLPSVPDMMKDIERKQSHNEAHVSSQRHTIQVFWIEYMDELAEEIGCKPNLKKLLVQDPKLALYCSLGPCFPSQYRIEGPGKWNGARKAVLGGWERSLAPLKSNMVSRPCKKETNKCDVITMPNWMKSYFVFMFIFFFIFCTLIA